MERNHGREKQPEGQSSFPVIVKSHLKCFICKTHHSFTLPEGITLEKYNRDLLYFTSGEKKIQHALNYLNSDQRELLLTGYCSKAWDALFGEEDE